MSNKRIIAIVMLICITLSLAPGAMAAQLTDVSGHWAEKEIQKWAETGIIAGYENGSFLPDNEITRAEFARIVNNLFGYVNLAGSAGSDVSDTAWYAPEMKKAVAAGYLKGYGDGTTAPEKPLTREEAAVMLCRTFALNSLASAAFTDDDKISTWAKESVSTLYAAGGIGGYPDGSFRPGAYISRAEVIKIIDNLVALMLGEAGLYDLGVNGEKQVIEGNLFVAAEDIVLKNAVIKGNLYVAPAVGEGDAAFYNVTVEGNVFVQGGGISTVKFFGCSLLSLNISKQSPVRVVFDSGDAAVIENTSSGSKIELTGGSAVDSVILTAKTDVKVEEGASISALEVTGGAQGTTVTGGGTVSEITTETGDITLGSGLQTGTITDPEGNNIEVGHEEPAVVIPPAPPAPITTVTVTDAADLQAALDNTQYTTVAISGALGDNQSYGVYRITRPVTVQGATGASADTVYGAFIVEVDGVTFMNMTVRNEGSDTSGSLHRNAISFLGNSITVKNCIIASDGGKLANGLSILTRTAGSVNYDITGNEFAGYNRIYNGSASAAIVISGNLTLTSGKPFYNNGNPVSSGLASNVNDIDLFTLNTFTNCTLDYQRLNYSDYNACVVCSVTTGAGTFYSEMASAAAGAKFYIKGNTTLSSSATIKAGSELIILDGAVLNIAAGVSLTGSGSIVFESGSTLANSSTIVFESAVPMSNTFVATTRFIWDTNEWKISP